MEVDMLKLPANFYIMNLQRQIREAREALGWSQRRLADEVGVSVRGVSNWETGTSIPRGSRLAAIEAKLNTHLRPQPTIHAGGEPLAMQWRVGRSVGRTLYAQPGDAPSDNDILIGLVDTPALAARLVIDHNHALTCTRRGDLMTTSNPTAYSPALLGYPQHQFTIDQVVRPISKGQATDPGFEPTYRAGDQGRVETLSEDGFKVGVRFTDDGFCTYNAFDLKGI